jgi:hypothetical protein
MPGKIKDMVAITPGRRGRGRPKVFDGVARRVFVFLPEELHEACERMRQEHSLGSFGEAHRQLLREAALARGLIRPRK